ncbi:hypothetical protein [Streptomyces vinaceus]|uniref:hypothetical protein n=1 Tax=Streptomyces vinaceus TaxID=1960 RepID=UPI00368C3C18
MSRVVIRLEQIRKTLDGALAVRLSSATRRWTGSAPKRVSGTTSTMVASGDSRPAARNAMPGR